MNFRKELEFIAESQNSPKLEDIKKRLRNVASYGKKETTFNSELYDDLVIKWLKVEGFTVKLTQDQRGGDFIRVSW
jgi:hypothetical protein